MIIQLDLKKAFDTVDQNLLLGKLCQIGVRDKESNWFSSYIKNRHFVLESKEDGGEITKNSIGKFDMGIAQGTILGPLLFNFFINDITKHTLSGQLYLYADDITLLYHSPTIEVIKRLVEEDFTILGHWFRTNRLVLNLEKCQFLTFNLKKPQADIDLFFNGSKIQQKNNVNILGVIYDHQLNFKQHIKSIDKKLRKKTGILKKVGGFLPVDSMKTLFHSIIMPNLNYCSEIWGSAANTNLMPLNLLHKKAIRIVFAENRLSHTDPLYKRANILPFFAHLNFNTCKFIYKSMAGLNSKKCRGFFRKKHSGGVTTGGITSGGRTRSSTKGLLEVGLFRTEAAKRSIFSSGKLIYNSLPQDMRETDSYQFFKSKLKNHLLLS